jgi:hypothetical protein
MNFATCENYEVKIWIGSIRGYNGKKFLLKTLLKKIGEFQKKHEKPCSLRVSPTTFIFQDYIENGWEIVCLNYPKFPKTPEEIDDFMMKLVQFLLIELEQNRITISDMIHAVTLEADNAEQHSLWNVKKQTNILDNS